IGALVRSRQQVDDEAGEVVQLGGIVRAPGRDELAKGGREAVDAAGMMGGDALFAQAGEEVVRGRHALAQRLGDRIGRDAAGARRRGGEREAPRPAALLARCSAPVDSFSTASWRALLARLPAARISAPSDRYTGAARAGVA